MITTLITMESDRMDLSRWTLFSLLDKEFLSRVRLACVFGNLGNEAILVTHDDEVWAFGSNGAACLGLGDMNSSLEPRRVDALCHKGVVSLSYGSGPHVLACTKGGEVYTWGHNGYCQLGNGSTSSQVMLPALVGGSLSGKMIVKVCCGSHHSVCLADNGEIFAWGQNSSGRIGNGTTTNQATPRKISSFGGSKRVLSLSCGQTSTVVALDSGEVFGWGYNGNGQLGLGNNINQLNPCRVSGITGVVVKVACGYAHTLALTDQGDLYGWGANSYGQLGTGNKANSCSPTLVGSSVIGRVVDVGASHYNHISACLSHVGKVFMWG